MTVNLTAIIICSIICFTIIVLVYIGGGRKK